MKNYMTSQQKRQVKTMVKTIMGYPHVELCTVQNTMNGVFINNTYFGLDILDAGLCVLKTFKERKKRNEIIPSAVETELEKLSKMLSETNFR